MSKGLLSLVIFATVCTCTFASTRGRFGPQQAEGRELELQVDPETGSNQQSTDLAVPESSSYFNFNLDWITNPFANLRVEDAVKSTAIFGGMCLAIFTFYTFTDWAYKTLKGLETRGSENLKSLNEAKEKTDLTAVDRKKRMIESAETTQAVLEAVENLAKKYWK